MAPVSGAETDPTRNLGGNPCPDGSLLRLHELDEAVVALQPSQLFPEVGVKSYETGSGSQPTVHGSNRRDCDGAHSVFLGRVDGFVDVESARD